jgi:N-glycosylase/DNA lyase
VCDKIISDLRAEGLIGCRDPESLQPYLKRTRFYKNKSRYLAEARRVCDRDGTLSIKDKIDAGNVPAAREWLVRNIKGIGYKEASHFLRNIGLGDSIAILDVHILRRLRSLGVIAEVPKTLTRKRYLEIESLMRDFSKRVKIPLAHMDLLFWSMATGKIFK